MSQNKLPDEPQDNTKQTAHTYTPRSHEELLKKFSRNTIKGEDVKDIKSENEQLKGELNTSKKRMKRLQRRIMILESMKRKEVSDNSSVLPSVPEIRSDIRSEIQLDTDDDYVKSWEVLGHHFSEVIRRHHDVLAEKDRQIRELQEKQYGRELSNRLLNYSSNDNASQNDENTISNINMLYDGSRALGLKGNNVKFRNYTSLQDGNEAGPSGNCKFADQYTENPVYGEDGLVTSGETLSEHFSEVIRRHKQQLFGKDQQIRELQEALEQYLGGNPRKRGDDSEEQMWYHDYHDPSQPSIRTQHAAPGSANSTPSSRQPRGAHLGPSPTKSKPIHGDEWKLSSDEEEDSLIGSTDTFVAIEKCQRLESIANLERLRQSLIQRLELEEKLDKLYWQTELNRYRALCEEAGDNFDPNSSFNKNFDMLESTRLELLRALKDLKVSALSKPELYVQPHVPPQDSVNVVKPQLQSLESESKRRVKFTEQITITTVQSTYES